MYLHEGFVIGSNFLNVDVVLAVNIRFCCAVRVGYGNNRRHILEVTVCVHFDLPETSVGVSNLDDHREASGTQLYNERKRNITSKEHVDRRSFPENVYASFLLL